MAGQEKVKKKLPKRTGKEQKKRMMAKAPGPGVRRTKRRLENQRQQEANDKLLKEAGVTWSTRTQRRHLLKELKRKAKES